MGLDTLCNCTIRCTLVSTLAAVVQSDIHLSTLSIVLQSDIHWSKLYSRLYNQIYTNLHSSCTVLQYTIIYYNELDGCTIGCTMVSYTLIGGYYNAIYNALTPTVIQHFWSVVQPMMSSWLYNRIYSRESVIQLYIKCPQNTQWLHHVCGRL